MKTLLSASGQVGLVDVGRAEVEEPVKDAVDVLMADASLSARNDRATEAKENEVYTILKRNGGRMQTDHLPLYAQGLAELEILCDCSRNKA